MRVYAGIDEAGYGPMFGPLLIGRATLAFDGDGEATPDVWSVLGAAICKEPSRRPGSRIAVNDSKKLHSPAAGIRHLERGVLAFAGQMGVRPACVREWLDALGETTHHDLSPLPWYAAGDTRPWEPLPRRSSSGEAAIDRAVLGRACDAAGVRVLDVGAAVVFEDRFNHMVAATRSKAAASFTFVARHLVAIWDRFGDHRPVVVVDRQSGRMFYRELLMQAFPGTRMAVLDENPAASRYQIDAADGSRGMTVSFEVQADGTHLPVALASMIAKYTRELLMARFQCYFTHVAPHIKPTAGYAADAKRFWREIEPLLPSLAIDGAMLLRMA